MDFMRTILTADIDVIISITAKNRLVAKAFYVDDVIAVATGNDVISGTGSYIVCPVATGQRIIACTAD